MDEVLAEYVANQSVNWWEGRPWWWLWIVLPGIFLLLWGLGNYKSKKEYGEWLIGKEFVMELMRSLCGPVRVLLALPVHKPSVHSTDGAFVDLTQSSYDLAIEQARIKMLNEGWNLNYYRRRSLDCDDFAMKLKCETVKIMQPMIPDNKAANIAIVGYTRDDGVGHVVVKAGDCYYEPYPEESGSMELSGAEERSIDLFVR